MSDGTFKIILAKTSPGCRIELDGRDITHIVRGLEISAHVKHVTTLTLEFIPTRVEIDGDAELIARLYDPTGTNSLPEGVPI